MAAPPCKTKQQQTSNLLPGHPALPSICEEYLLYGRPQESHILDTPPPAPLPPRIDSAACALTGTRCTCKLKIVEPDYHTLRCGESARQTCSLCQHDEWLATTYSAETWALRHLMKGRRSRVSPRPTANGASTCSHSTSTPDLTDDPPFRKLAAKIDQGLPSPNITHSSCSIRCYGIIRTAPNGKFHSPGRCSLDYLSNAQPLATPQVRVVYTTWVAQGERVTFLR